MSGTAKQLFSRISLQSIPDTLSAPARARPQDTRRWHSHHLPLGLEHRMSLGSGLRNRLLRRLASCRAAKACWAGRQARPTAATLPGVLRRHSVENLA